MTTTTMFSAPISRRSVIKFAFGATAAIAVGGVALTSNADARSGGAYRTTTALNFREQPNTSSKVLAVLPKDTTVGYLGERKNGFLAVSYQGMSGWAYESFLAFIEDGPSDPVIIGSAVVTSAANFRSGPSTGHQVFRVLSAGTSVQISDTVRDGYRYIIHDGQAGWLYDAFLGQDDGGNGDGPGVFYTTSAVNLRAQPSTSSKVLMVVPPDAQVLDYDFVMSNGFRGVDYNGNVGWIYDDFLAQ